MPVMDMFWGERYGQLRDPFGHIWSIATQTKPEPGRNTGSGELS